MTEIEAGTKTIEEVQKIIFFKFQFNELEQTYINEVLELWDDTMNFGMGGNLIDCIGGWATDNTDEPYVIGAKILDKALIEKEKEEKEQNKLEIEYQQMEEGYWLDEGHGTEVLSNRRYDENYRGPERTIYD